jgi:TonB family protein
MTDKKGHNEGLETLLRYLKDQLSNKERYDFERELEREPFLAEAFEGLSEHDPLSIERDLKNMDVVGGKRKAGKRLLLPLSIAAGFALIILAVFWIVNSENDRKQPIAEDVTVKETIPVIDSISKEVDSVLADTSETKFFIAEAEMAAKEIVKAQPVVDKPVVDKKKKTIGPTKVVEQDAIEKMDASVAVKPQSTTISAQLQGIMAVKAAGDFEPDADSVEESLQEAVMSNTEAGATPSSVESKKVELNKRPGVNASPEPLGGNALFREYLSENLKYPSEAESAGRETVRLTFKITELGEPFGFEIIRSPGKAFSEEAIRVIKEGPKWSPEVKDGIPVEGEVSLRIVFRP